MERTVENKNQATKIAAMDVLEDKELRKTRAIDRGNLVKRLRKQSRYKTQDKLATYCGCKKSYISQIEKGGDFDIKGSIQIRMAEALGIEPGELSLTKPAKSTDTRALVKIIDGVDRAFEQAHTRMTNEDKAEFVALLTPIYRESHTVEDIARFVLSLIDIQSR